MIMMTPAVFFINHKVFTFAYGSDFRGAGNGQSPAAKVQSHFVRPKCGVVIRKDFILISKL